MTNLREISPEEGEKEEYKNYVPIDLRDEAEYQLGHIDNAKWMAISDLLRDDKVLDPSKAYLFYCKYGTISRELGERLSGSQFKRRLRTVYPHENQVCFRRGTTGGD